MPEAGNNKNEDSELQQSQTTELEFSFMFSI